MDIHGFLGGGLFIFLLLIWVGLVAFFIVALVSIIQARTHTPGYRALWALASLAAPFLGPLFWFIWGRKDGNVVVAEFPSSASEPYLGNQTYPEPPQPPIG